MKIMCLYYAYHVQQVMVFTVLFRSNSYPIISNLCAFYMKLVKAALFFNDVIQQKIFL